MRGTNGRAGGSHPITIKDPEVVKVLISSQALAQEFPGKGAVLIRFQVPISLYFHLSTSSHSNVSLHHSALSLIHHGGLLVNGCASICKVQFTI